MAYPIQNRIMSVIEDYHDEYISLKSATEKIMQIITEVEHEAYQEGYNNGYSDCETTLREHSVIEFNKAYNNGYNNALSLLKHNIHIDSTIPVNVKRRIYEHINYIRIKK